MTFLCTCGGEIDFSSKVVLKKETDGVDLNGLFCEECGKIYNHLTGDEVHKTLRPLRDEESRAAYLSDGKVLWV